MAERWRDKYPADVFEHLMNWAEPLTAWADTIDTVAADLVHGTVTVNAPDPTTFAANLQAVWVSGGLPGWQIVRCTVQTVGGRVFTEEAGFMVL